MALHEPFNKGGDRGCCLSRLHKYVILLRFNLRISDHYFCSTGCNYKCTSANHTITRIKLSYRNVGNVQCKNTFLDKLKFNYFDPIVRAISCYTVMEILLPEIQSTDNRSIARHRYLKEIYSLTIIIFLLLFVIFF